MSSMFSITPKKDDEVQGDITDVHSGVACIESGDEIVVEAKKQSITIGCMDIEGCLTVEGQLFVLNLGDV